MIKTLMQGMANNIKRSLVLLLLVSCVAGWLWWQPGSNDSGHAVIDVARGDIEQLVTATGSLQPRDYVDVGAQVSGQLQKLHVAVGDMVEKGQLLAEIDATVYRAKVDASRAQLRSLQAQMLERQAQLKLAQLNSERQRNLYREDAGSREAMEMAEASLQSSQAQITALKAQIEQTASGLRAEEANLDYARIYAPITGTVVSIAARQGQTLNANQTTPTVLQIADLSVMQVKAQVSEADIGKLKAGMAVYFTTLGSGSRRWYSRLDRIEPTPEVLNNVVLYNAMFEVPNEDGRLMTQMTTQVFFVVAEAKNVLQLPLSVLDFSAASGSRKPGRPAEQAIHRRAIARVVAANGHSENRTVTIGVSNRVMAEIIDGLAEGDKVLAARPAATGSNADSTRGGFGPRIPR